MGIEKTAFDFIEWAVAALLALGASVVALKAFKLAPLWAVVIGILVFTGLQIPISTHAVMLKMPESK
jgi:hypothetical protein